MRHWLLVGLLAATPAAAATFTENQILCDQELTARWVDRDQTQAGVFVQCLTVDSSGAIIRSRREYNVFSRLSAAQKTGVAAMLTQLQAFAADVAGVPTPTPTPTTTARTPTPTPTATP